MTVTGTLSKTSAYLSKEQFYKECHISKATALRLIQSGLIPAIDTKKKTNRYFIAREDIEEFKRERERDPSKYALSVKPIVSTCGAFREYQRSGAIKMRQIAQVEWSNLPDILCVKDVAHLLGYRSETIYRWIKKLGLNGLKISGIHYIPQKCLLEFIASPEFHSVHPKSSQHIDLLRRSYHA
ncbi:helix-turn-helix domain-containing protein [Intestinimonas butyriciproducens]|jgi:hypothetical protein|uniref:helix-turn-helix domain-containing protein n=1 Tax=Intestinimonas butyriciproducens TaxID=1297617 RepID=UPI0023F11AFF|nr:helix-turn-helix domain-containing protein [Intestinimonas timonensis]